MSNQNGSAEIVELESERSRLRAGESGPDAWRDAGSYLAAAREAKGISLSEAADRTHIRLSHLQAIEEMAEGALPPRPYAIGFVKTYAAFLGLDIDAVVARFKEDLSDAAQSPQPSRPAPEIEATPTADELETKEMSFFALAGVIFFILWCCWQLTKPRDVVAIGDAPAATVEAAPASSTANPAVVDLTPPTPLETIEPIYPRSCLNQAGPEESVTISFAVTASGAVANERVLSATKSCFSDAALNAIRRWRFAPATANGAPKPAFDQTKTFIFDKPL